MAVLVGIQPAGTAFSVNGDTEAGQATGRRIPVPAGARIVVTDVSGPVQALPGRAGVLVVESPGGDPGVSITRRGDDLHVTIERPASKAATRLRVPPGSPLEVHTRSGDITVQLLRSPVRMESDTGRLLAEDVTGGVAAGTVNGDIELRRVTGGASANSVSGSILLEAVDGVVRATCISGNIVMADLGSEEVSASSTGGDIRFSGALVRGARYVLSNHSGDIRFSISGPEGCRLNLSTYSGSIAIPLEAALEGDRISRRSLSAVWGSPSASVELTSFSGNISVAASAPPG